MLSEKIKNNLKQCTFKTVTLKKTHWSGRVNSFCHLFVMGLSVAVVRLPVGQVHQSEFSDKSLWGEAPGRGDVPPCQFPLAWEITKSRASRSSQYIPALFVWLRMDLDYQLCGDSYQICQTISRSEGSVKTCIMKEEKKTLKVALKSHFWGKYILRNPRPRTDI